MAAGQLAKLGSNIGVAVLIFLVGLMGSLLPLAVNRLAPASRKWKDCSELFLSLGSCFGGGVFIAAGFIHLLGDASDDMTDYMNTNCTFSNKVCDYPWEMLACSIGLLVTMLVDSIPRILRDKKYGRLFCKRPEASVTEDHNGIQVYGAIENRDDNEMNITRSPIVAYILFGALSFHSFMSGLALGVAKNGFNPLLFAILAHKGFAAFALGAEFVRTQHPNQRQDSYSLGFGDARHGRWCSGPCGVTVRIAACMFAFCLATPLGLIIGSVALGDEEGLAIALVTAIAAGTFLYVGIVEITAMELLGKPQEGRTVTKAFVVALGFGLMALLGVWS